MTMSRLETRTKESSVFVNGYNSSWKRGMKVNGMNNTNLASMGGCQSTAALWFSVETNVLGPERL
jgi:hypothetical protein